MTNDTQTDDLMGEIFRQAAETITLEVRNLEKRLNQIQNDLNNIKKDFPEFFGKEEA